jgi:hypothetical protein
MFSFMFSRLGPQMHALARTSDWFSFLSACKSSTTCELLCFNAYSCYQCGGSQTIVFSRINCICIRLSDGHSSVSLCALSCSASFHSTCFHDLLFTTW